MEPPARQADLLVEREGLALGCITEPMTLLDGLTAWFQYAEERLAIGETEDPAKVAPHAIKMRKSKGEVLWALAGAREHLARAVELEDAGYPVLAHSELAKLFNDEGMLPAPGKIAVEAEQARCAREEAARRGEHGRRTNDARSPSGGDDPAGPGAVVVAVTAQWRRGSA